MGTYLVIATISILITHLVLSVKRRCVIIKLKPDSQEIATLLTLLEIVDMDDVVFFSFLYRRRRLYVDDWVGLRYALRRGDTVNVREYIKRIEQEGYIDREHLKSSYDTYESLCMMQYQSRQGDLSPVELVELFKPNFVSVFGNNGDGDANALVSS